VPIDLGDQNEFVRIAQTSPWPLATPYVLNSATHGVESTVAP
jgi:hypothetical protein